MGMKLLDGPLGWVAVVLSAIAVVFLSLADLGKPGNPADEICAEAKKTDTVCTIQDGKLVTAGDSVYLVIGKKVFQLQ